eukprot:3939074-Rhodomonas_salina.1
MTETHKGTITVAARGSGFGRGGIVRWDVHGGAGGGVEGGRGATLRQLAQQSALQRGADLKETCQHARQQRKWIEKMLEAEEAKQRGGDLVRREGDRAGLMLALQRLALLPMTKEVLVETDVGVVVKGLRKHGDAGVREMAKSVVVQWKALLRPTYPLTLPVQVLSHRGRECEGCGGASGGREGGLSIQRESVQRLRRQRERKKVLKERERVLKRVRGVETERAKEGPEAHVWYAGTAVI